MKVIFVVAADPSRDRRGNVVIGDDTRVVCDHARRLVQVHIDNALLTSCAETADISAQMEKLAEFCSTSAVSEVTLVVRGWQAGRAKAECVYWLGRRHIFLNIKVSKCPSDASFHARIEEFFVSRPRSFLRRLLTPLPLPVPVVRERIGPE